MEQYFSTTFEDVRHGRPLIFLLASTGPDKIKQTAFSDQEIKIEENLSSEIINRQKILKDYVAVSLIE